ncbi:MAG TPA: DNA translocase FtsK [Candidatus Bathyarchaeia archaeon]|nr:DNA translocase FtsK [Candidatus Bathyarchaeia archaeon]
MWSWLLKLMQFFRDEEDEGLEKHETRDKETRSVYPSSQLQAKTKNIYPRERESSYTPRRSREKERAFRFPVIPDQPKEKRQQPESTKWEYQAASRTEHFQPKTEQPKNSSHTYTPEKRPYTPTEVVSPIYGRLKPEREQRNERASEQRAEPTEMNQQPQERGTMPDLSKQLPEPNWTKLLLAMDRVGERKAAELPAKSSGVSDSRSELEAPQINPVDAEVEEAHVERNDMHTELAVAALAETAAASETDSEAADSVMIFPVKEWRALSAAKNELPANEELPVEEELADRMESEEVTVSEQELSVHTNESEFSYKEDAEAIEPLPVIEEPTAAPLLPEESHPANEWHRMEEIPAATRQETTSMEETVGEFTQVEPVLAEIPQEAAVPPILERIEPVQNEQADYLYPEISLLDPSPQATRDDDEHTQIQRLLLEDTLSNFNVSAQVIGIVKGPSVTRFELQPSPGVKVNKITGLIDDIKLNLAAKDIRIEAPIPGRNAVGIEVPNLKSEPIFIRRIIESDKFRNHPSPLAIALGMDIGGEPIVTDIKKMPHGLIAGSTGSGKSVCINSIIVSLLYKATPEQVRLLLIDPKMVELAPYNHLPHLVTPVVTDAKQATAALKWAVEEMERRYTLFVDAGARDIERYNQTTNEPLPYIVIIIDELADLMMVSPQDVEECIIRIAQKARACGIHLLLATQRPSVDVITGNIKANVPTRLAFAVFSQIDSRTILDQSGAERLLGRGDMLFLESGATPLRLQGNYVSDDEIERITTRIKKQRKPEYLFSKEDLEQSVQSFDMGDDPLYLEALIHVAEQGQASASALQRRFRIGYNRAARLIDMMEAEGHVSGQSGGKARTVLITREDAQALMDGSTLV